MDHSIKEDHSRFRKIVRSKVRGNLRKYVSQGEIPIEKGGQKYSISMPSVEIPRFRFGERQQGGVGQGEGQPGDSLEGKGEEKKERGQSGCEEGPKELEVDFSLEELASILGEELELPHIEPKGQRTLPKSTEKYRSISKVGSDSLKHFKRSYKEALKREIAGGFYDEKNPVIIPIKRDMRYRTSSQATECENSAVVIYMMDVSGSMGDEQKEIVRTESFWINLWLKAQYKNIEICYIIHDATAKQVDEEVFFRTKEAGGTLISSAFELCWKIIEENYNPHDWNIYPFHFSDGDNWSTDDSKLCVKLLNEKILPASNSFCYGQVESRYGSGQFYQDLHAAYGNNHKKIILSKIKSKEAILDSIKDFLGKKL